MKKIGIIAEYNPLHNGHIYHIKKIKEIYPDSLIILVMSGNFTQRGDTSIINKWNKTKLALEYVDLVIELPFVFATQGADIFAHGSIQILNNLKVDNIIFGSESNNIELLAKLAHTQTSTEYNNKVKEYVKNGINYPTALSNALKEICKETVTKPNDILGVCYIKEIIKQNSNIIPITIKRTNDYNDTKINSNILSATAIRLLIKEKKDTSPYVPKEILNYINEKTIEDFYPLLKYKIITEKNLNIYETVDEGITYRIKKYINKSNTLDELINNVKTKYYTYNRLKRMFLHIICNFTKEENKKCKDIHYIRILGFNKKGKNYIKEIKKHTNIPIISNFTKLDDIMLEIENRTTNIYSLIYKNTSELEKPIIRQ